MPIIGGQSGSFIRTAKALVGFATASTSVTRSTNNATGAAFWTGANSVADFCAVDSTAYTGAAYKTLLNVSGKGGWVSTIIGPEVANNTDTLTIRLTIDGTVTSKVISANTTLLRLGAGANSWTLAPGNNENGDYTTNSYASITNAVRPLSVRQAFQHCPGQLIRFDNSFLCELMVTSSQSTATNYERYSAVSYLLDS